MSEIDRARAEKLLAAEGLEGMVLFRPEAFRYATGLAAGVATMWGRAGSAIALVPADAGAPLAAVMSDHAAGRARPIDIRTHRIWIDGVTIANATSIDQIDAAYRAGGNTGPRPETFDQDACFGLLADLLAERGLLRATLGVDAYLAFVERQHSGFVALMRGGVGSDPEVAAVLERVRVAILDEFLEGAPISKVLRSRPMARIAIRSWIGLVEAASIEWLATRDVPRDSVRDLLVDALFDMLGRVLAPRDARRYR